MALLERVATLIKANLNDLIDKAENPEKLLKQLLLDMQNQFMQVKTQVAKPLPVSFSLRKKQTRESGTAARVGAQSRTSSYKEGGGTGADRAERSMI